MLAHAYTHIPIKTIKKLAHTHSTINKNTWKPIANQMEAYPHTYTTNHQTISKHKGNLGFLEKHTVLQKPAIPAVGCPFRVIKCPLKK